MRTAISLVFSFLLFTSCAPDTADLIIHNATVYTVNESFETATAVVVKDGPDGHMGIGVPARWTPRSDLLSLEILQKFIRLHKQRICYHGMDVQIYLFCIIRKGLSSRALWRSVPWLDYL